MKILGYLYNTATSVRELTLSFQSLMRSCILLFYAMPNVWHQIGDFVCVYDIHLICTCRLPESSDYNVIQCDQRHATVVPFPLHEHSAKKCSCITVVHELSINISSKQTVILFVFVSVQYALAPTSTFPRQESILSRQITGE